MISLTIVLNGDGLLEGFPKDQVLVLDVPITVTALEAGMESGLPSVTFIFDLPDGRKVFAQTSLKLFMLAARAMEAKFGDLLTERHG
jgi:hypothetical protein